ncbi:hypothetical protein V2J09_018195 [Rumex salicifolius]
MAPTEPWPLSLAMHVSELERRVHNQIRLNGESPITPREQQNRFLCVSDGFSIYCLDLDQAGGDFIDYAETLPVVSTINLLEERLPIASALFQLGSAGLMIGGKEIHKFEQPTDRLMLPEEIFNKYNFKGSSKATYQLFLAEGWFDKLVPGYAVIGFQNCISEDEDDDGLDVIAMAVLVTPSGEVICHQSLPGFFDGIKPIDMHKATIFRVGDSTTSSTMFCVVLMGDYYSRTEPGSERVLYISTFCVEEANLEGGFSGSLEEVEERKFLKIVLKKRQMYKLGRNFGFGADPDSDFCPTLRLTACFI